MLTSPPGRTAARAASRPSAGSSTTSRTAWTSRTSAEPVGTTSSREDRSPWWPATRSATPLSAARRSREARASGLGSTTTTECPRPANGTASPPLPPPASTTVAPEASSGRASSACRSSCQTVDSRRDAHDGTDDGTDDGWLTDTTRTLVAPRLLVPVHETGSEVAERPVLRATTRSAAAGGTGPGGGGPGGKGPGRRGSGRMRSGRRDPDGERAAVVGTPVEDQRGDQQRRPGPDGH